MGFDRGQFDEDAKLSDGSKFEIAKIYPLDATFDTKELVPESVSTSKRYKQFSGYSIQEVAEQVAADFGKIDYLVHSLANGPEVTKPLLETSREGYLVSFFKNILYGNQNNRICPSFSGSKLCFCVLAGVNGPTLCSSDESWRCRYLAHVLGL